MIKLVAIDLDGTLLNPSREISLENKRAIEIARENGIKVVLATGRPFKGIEKFLEELNLNKSNEYSITNTGAMVFENKSQKTIVENALTLDDYKKIEKLIEGYDIQLSIYTSFNLYNFSKTPNKASIKDSNILKMEIKLPDVDFNESIGRINAMGEERELNKFQKYISEELSDDYFLMRNETFSLEILNKNCGKGKALRQLSEELGLNTNEVAAIGDNLNDLEMLDYAGYSIAMGNSKNILKEKANFVTRSNDQNGVAYAIRNIMLL